MESKWQLILHEKCEDPYYEITNGPISLIANCGFVGEDDADEDNIFNRVKDELNISGIDFHSGNKLELKQHLEIQELKYKMDELVQENEQLRRWKAEALILLSLVDAYADKHPEIKLGQGKVEFTIAMAKERDALKERCEKMEAALSIVRDWKLPSTDQFWDDDKTQPMSYGACYGSNGERDFMKHIANEILKEGESNTPAPSNVEKITPEWVTWLTDNSPNIPNLTNIGEEEKQAIVQTLFQSCGHQFMKLFYALDLKTHMECGFVNEPTNELFRLRFELMQKGNTPAPVQVEKVTISKCGNCGSEGVNHYIGNQYFLCDECMESPENI